MLTWESPKEMIFEMPVRPRARDLIFRVSRASSVRRAAAVDRPTQKSFLVVTNAPVVRPTAVAVRSIARTRGWLTERTAYRSAPSIGPLSCGVARVQTFSVRAARDASWRDEPR